jgi:hypothetical protein
MIISKSTFAKRCNVSPGRVSQWLSARQIDGAAIVGKGQRAKLDAALALRQLKLRLSVDERFGMNGLNTNLDWLPDADDVTDDDDGMDEIIADQKKYVTLNAAKDALDQLWVLMDLNVQSALAPFPEARAAYDKIRDELADAKWRLQGVEPPVY